jgi:hypothetical protein
LNCNFPFHPSTLWMRKPRVRVFLASSLCLSSNPYFPCHFFAVLPSFLQFLFFTQIIAHFHISIERYYSTTSAMTNTSATNKSITIEIKDCKTLQQCKNGCELCTSTIPQKLDTIKYYPETDNKFHYYFMN